MRRGQRWLSERLAVWHAQGLIDDETVQGIEAFEAAAGVHPKGQVARMVAGLGGACIALGVILVIAFNWEHISGPVRIGGYLGLLVGASLLYMRKAAAVVGQAAGVVWLLLPLAGVGLYGQLFQLSSDLIKGNLLAFVLAAPLGIFASQRVLGAVHAVAAAALATLLAFAPSRLVSFDGPRGLSMWPFITTYGVTAGLAAALVVYVLWQGARWGSLGRALSVGFVAVYAVLLTQADAFSGDSGASALWVAALVVPCLWGASIALGGGRALETLKYLWTLVLFYVLTLDVDAKAAMHSRNVSAWIVPLALVALAIFTHRERQRFARGIATGKARVLPLLVTLPWWPGLLVVLAPFVPPYVVVSLAHVGFVALSLAMMAIGLEQGRASPINLALLALTVLLVIRFLDYFGSMLASGFGFILTGLFFLVLSYAVGKGRGILLRRAETQP